MATIWNRAERDRLCSSPKGQRGGADQTHYCHSLTELGKRPGLIGVIFCKAQKKIQDAAKRRWSRSRRGRRIRSADHRQACTVIAAALAIHPFTWTAPPSPRRVCKQRTLVIPRRDRVSIERLAGPLRRLVAAGRVSLSGAPAA